MKSEKLIPDDSYFMICILNQDIYNKEYWLFVFGVRVIRERTWGLALLALIQNLSTFLYLFEEEFKDLISWRRIKVMIHEIGYMFGMIHLVYTLLISIEY